MGWRKFFLYLTIATFVLLLVNTAYTNKKSADKISLAKNLFLIKHDTDKAADLLEKTISKDSNNAEAWFLLGRIYFVQNGLNKSEQAYLKAIKLAPSNEQAYYGLGLTYGYLNNLQLAEFNFKKYLEIIETKIQSGEYAAYPSGHWAGYNDLAWVYFLQGNFVEAEKVTREALGKYNNPWLLNMLGAVLLNQGKNLEAKSYFSQAKTYAQNMSAEDFGEAYTGDSKEWHEKGFSNMKAVIEENIKKSEMAE